MTELKLILVGMSGVGKSAAGNTILGREEFKSETSPSSLTLMSEEREGEVCGRRVLVVDTPGLDSSGLSEWKLKEEMKTAMSLCDRRPNALLLVIQLGRFTQREMNVMETLQKLFSERVNQHTMVLFTYGDRLRRKTIEQFIYDDTNLQQLVYKCGNRYHVFNNQQMENRSQVSELLQKIDNMVGTERKTMVEEESKGRDIHHATNSTRKQWNPDPHRQPTASETASMTELRLVLVGMSGVGKSAAGNIILGREKFKSETSPSSLTLMSEGREGEVCGRRVIVVDTPGLDSSGLSEWKLKEEMKTAMSLCDPGPHALLLVIQLGRFTQREMNVMETLQKLFSKRVNQHTMVLFTYGDRLKRKTIEQFIYDDTHLQQLVYKCGNQYHVFNNLQMENRSQVAELLQKIDRMLGTERKIMVNEEPKERDIHHGKSSSGTLWNPDPHSQATASAPEKQQTNELRIMLVGKTGEGNSAAGNTILGKRGFAPSSRSLHCETANMDGKDVAVIVTPGLFDTRDENDIKQQIEKCISLSSPGPHVFLVVIQLGRFTEEEQNTGKIIRETFGSESSKYTIALFTHGERLGGKTIETFLSGNKKLAEFTDQCRGGYHVFNNEDMQNRTQVSELLQKINRMVTINGGGCYTNEMYRKAEEIIRAEKSRVLRHREPHLRESEDELRMIADRAAAEAVRHYSRQRQQCTIM